MTWVRNPPPTEDSTAMPAPAIPVAMSNGQNALAHSSDRITVGEAERSPRLPGPAIRCTQSRTPSCICWIPSPGPAWTRPLIRLLWPMSQPLKTGERREDVRVVGAATPESKPRSPKTRKLSWSGLPALNRRPLRPERRRAASPRGGLQARAGVVAPYRVRKRVKRHQLQFGGADARAAGHPQARGVDAEPAVLRTATPASLHLGHPPVPAQLRRNYRRWPDPAPRPGRHDDAAGRTGRQPTGYPGRARSRPGSGIRLHRRLDRRTARGSRRSD